MGLKGLLEKMKLVEAEDAGDEAVPVEPAPSVASVRRPVSAPSAVAPRAAATMSEVLQKAPAPRLDPKAVPEGNDIPDFPAIYKASGVKDPAHGFTAYKILEILNSPDFAALDGKARAAALSGFLRMNPAGAVAITDVIQDALARDGALDGFETFLRSKLDAKRAGFEKENAALQAAIDELTLKNRALIQANQEAASREEERFSTWQARKRIEEQKLFEAVAPFVEANPVSVGNATPKPGAQF